MSTPASRSGSMGRRGGRRGGGGGLAGWLAAAWASQEQTNVDLIGQARAQSP